MGTLAEWVGAVGSIIVGLSAFLVAFATLRLQQSITPIEFKKLPSVQTRFDEIDADQVHRMSWRRLVIQCSGSSAYVRSIDVVRISPVGWDFIQPKLAIRRKRASLPPWVISETNPFRRWAHPDAFHPQTLKQGEELAFWFLCSHGEEEVMLRIECATSCFAKGRFVDLGPIRLN